MARYTKDFKKELRQIGGKFKWIELDASEQGIARERVRLAKLEGGRPGAAQAPSAPGGRSPGMGEKSDGKTRWFTRKAQAPSAPAVEAGRSGTAQGGSAPAGETGKNGHEASERKDRRDASSPASILLSAATTGKIDQGQLAEQIVGAHEILALLARNQIWRINGEQGKNLARAIDGIARHYRIPISDKALAWGQLVMVAGAVYGPKLMLVAMSPNAKAAKQPPATPAAQPGGIDVLNATANYGGPLKH